MARYIDAEKMLVTAVKDKKFIFTKEDALKDEVVVKTVYEDLAEFINSQPTADVVEVKHGEWIYKHRHRGGFERRTAYDEFNNPHTVTLDNRYECDEPYCSVCGKLGGDFLNYCGNCGAKMDGGKANDL